MSELIKASGKKHKLSAAKPGYKFTRRPGGILLVESPDGTRSRMLVHEARGKLSFGVGSYRIFGEVSEEQRGGVGAGAGDSDLIAQFPGKVRKIIVSLGAQVAEGEPLMLLEAMKMEFAVKAPFAGKIEKILVTEGQQLTPGTRLVDLKPASGTTEKTRG